MQVLENVLDTAYLEHLQYLVRKEITWLCLFDSAYGGIQEDNTDNFSFGHNLFNLKKNTESVFFPVFLPAVLTLINRFNYQAYKLLRVRLGLTTKSGQHGVIHKPHFDRDEPHKVIIFYINNSNGPTTIYQEKNTRSNTIPTIFNIIKQVDPVANRAFMFDGDYYHSSSKPTINNFRFVLNINFQQQ